MLAFSQERQLTLENLQGSWYNSSFLNALQKTKSVIQALYGVHFVAFEITKDRWLLIYNFHEGVRRQLAGISVVDDSNYALECTDCSNENTYFKLFSKDALRFSGGKNFKRIQNFTNFVNEATVSGVYVDDQSQIYFFYKSGLSLWPDDKFYYKVGLDVLEDGADFFEIRNREDENSRRMRYFFKTTAIGLEVYKIDNSEEWDRPVIKNKEPFLKLSKYEREFYDYLKDARFKHLEGQSKKQLRLLRNEIFARHRHSFDSPDLQSYFANKPWYHEYKDHKVSIGELSETELKVLKRIQNLEKNEK